MKEVKIPFDIVSYLEKHLSLLTPAHDAMMPAWRDATQWVDSFSGVGEGGTSYSSGLVNSKRRYDVVALNSANNLAATLYSLIFDMGSFPFDIRYVLSRKEDIKTKKHMELIDGAKRYLMDVIFGNGSSGAGSVLHSSLLDLIFYGTCVVYIDRTPKGMPRFRTFAIDDCYLGENSDRMIDVIYRKEEVSAIMLKQKFGNDANFPREILDQAMNPNKMGTMHTLWHCVFPSSYLDGHGVDVGKPYIEYYYIKKPNAILRTAGYDSFPFCIGRWKCRGNGVYGISPTAEAMDDIYFLNNLSRSYITSNQRNSSPPLLVSDTAMIPAARLRYLRPNEVVVYRPNPDGRTPPILNFPAVQLSEKVLDVIDKRQNAVRDFYLMDAVRPIQKKERQNPIESQQFGDSIARQLQMYVDKTQKELYLSILHRLIYILAQTNLGDGVNPFQVIRDDIERGDAEIVFTSKMNTVRDLIDVSNISRVLDILLKLPGADRVLDVPAIARYLQSKLFLPINLFRKREDSEGMEKQERDIAVAKEQTSVVKDIIQVANQQEGGDDVRTR